MTEIQSVKVPLIISEKLQKQISTLCYEIWDVEWSGTLFYRVEGEFGEPGFKVFAEELFLQDIGTQAYTEYQGGTPEFIQFLMSNTTLLDMKKGHIHSHNTMSVFFSGTDRDELRTNSEFYNYYVSLIVNNKNEMCAKIAFRVAIETNETVVINYKGNEGEVKQKHVNKTTSEEGVYTYDCEVVRSNMVEDSFRARIQDIRVAKAKEREKNSYRGSKGSTLYIPATEPGEFSFATEDRRESETDYSPESNPLVEGTEEQRVEMDLEAIVQQRNFLSRWLVMNNDNKKSLNKVLKTLDKQFYGTGKKVDVNIVSSYLTTLKDKEPEFYDLCFTNDLLWDNHNKNLDGCVEIMNDYQPTYPELVEQINAILESCKVEIGKIVTE